MFRILLVEDNEMNRDMLSRRLSRKGYAVSVAGDGLQGLAAAEAGALDLILMDLSLPEMDGWEVTRQLKSNPATRSIPVIALTAHAMAGDRERAFEAGCDDYDTKPIDFPRLLGKIESVLARSPRRGPDDEPRDPDDDEPLRKTQARELGQLRHDLVGPLVRIIGYCELLNEDAASPEQEPRRERLVQMKRLAQEARRSIDAALLNRDGQGQPSMTSLSQTLTLSTQEMLVVSQALLQGLQNAPDRNVVLDDLLRLANDVREFDRLARSLA